MEDSVASAEATEEDVEEATAEVTEEDVGEATVVLTAVNAD